jgi:hypothetical protein
MNKETLRMQMLAGVITEGEYVAIVNKEIEEADKASLNESMIGGIVGIGAINQIPPRAKTDYEMAFEHFLGERQSRIENPNQDPRPMEEGEEVTEEDFPKMDKIEDYDNPRQKFKWKGESISKDDLINAVENADDYSLVTYFAVSMFDPDGNLNSLQNLLVKKEIDKRGLLKDN